MVLNGFIGPSYRGTSPNVAVQTLKNWYTQRVEVEDTSGVTYYPRPGLSVYATLTGSPIRALFSQDGRDFAVAGKTLWELFANAVPLVRGTLTAVDANPATICSSGLAGHQLYITSGGHGDIYDLTANTLTPITATGYPLHTPMGTYLDTYFATIQGDTAQFNISAILDGLSWSTLDFAIRTQASDNLVGIVSFNKLLWLIGSRTSEPWYNSGATFPFASVPQVLIPIGCCAPFSIIRTSVALAWLHRSERGQGIFVMASDDNPKRVSTYAVEATWATYPTLEDCVCYSLTWEGHEFILLHFRSGNATWAYDIGEKSWSEWTWWNEVSGAHDRFRGWVHCDSDQGHLVGDWETGTVYLMDGRLATDADAPILWERTAPHLNRELLMNFYSNFQLDLEPGLGGHTPVARLNWSDDGGHTFSTPIDMDMGAIGDYPIRCRVPGNLGQSRNRAFRVRISNDVPPRPSNAYVDVVRGTS